MTLIAGVSILVALAYVPSGPSGEALPAQGGRYVEGVAGSPSCINPLFATFNDVDGDLVRLVFSGLVRLGANGSVESDLAETWKVTPDGLTYIFELNRGLYWHDGERADAQDVLFTIRAIQDSDFEGDPVLAELFRDVDVEAPNDRTVTMTLPQPFAPFLARGATVGILPEHLLSGPSATRLCDAPFGETPVGTGPFRLTGLTDTGAALRSFAAYHQGRPFLESLELRFYRDDGELLNALLNKEVDGALFRLGLEPEEMALLDDSSWVRRSLHGTVLSLVYLNLEVPAFQDSLVRQALQKGLDRVSLVNEVFDGQALPLDSPVVPDLWAHEGNSDAYAFDPARAALLLNAGGWDLEEAARVKEGTLLRFSLAASDDPVQVELAAEIARQWGELGIQVEVQVSGASQFVEGVLLPREFQAALVSIDPGPDPDPYPFWHSTQTLGEGRNLAGFADPAVDQLLENGREAASVAQRAADYRSFQEIFAQEMPGVLLHTPTYQYVVRSDLRGLSPGLLVSLSARFDDVHRWYVETETQADEDE
jgi:peptide/nickel transport system substrate-binding protein